MRLSTQLEGALHRICWIEMMAVSSYRLQTLQRCRWLRLPVFADLKYVLGFAVHASRQYHTLAPLIQSLLQIHFRSTRLDKAQ
jgi:hypothetical protein